MIESWLPYFAVTVAIELPIVAALVGRPRSVYDQLVRRRTQAQEDEAGEVATEEKPQGDNEKPRWTWRMDLHWRMRVVGIAFLINLTTHPFVTVIWLYVLPRDISRADELMYFYLIEVGVVIAEGLLLWIALPIRFRHAMLISLIANVPSAAVSPTLWK